MGVKYRITLTDEERKYLTDISSKGTGAARTVISARAILLLDRGDYAEEEQWTIEKVSKALGKSVRSLEYLKKRFVEEGLESAIKRKQRETPPREVLFGGDFEAKLIALACSKPPEGRTRWTIRLLTEKVVELKIAPSVSTATVCKTLKKPITASPEQILEDSTRPECIFCRCYGRYS